MRARDMTFREVGLWCRKGHVIDPDDDQGQCEAVGVAYVVDTPCEWTEIGWQVAE